LDALNVIVYHRVKCTATPYLQTANMSEGKAENGGRTKNDEEPNCTKSQKKRVASESVSSRSVRPVPHTSAPSSNSLRQVQALSVPNATIKMTPKEKDAKMKTTYNSGRNFPESGKKGTFGAHGQGRLDPGLDQWW